MADEHTADWLAARADATEATGPMGWNPAYPPLLDDPSITPTTEAPDPQDTDYDAWFDARIENRSPA